MACSAVPKCNDRIQQIDTMSAFGSGPFAGVLALLHGGFLIRAAGEKWLKMARRRHLLGLRSLCRGLQRALWPTSETSKLKRRAAERPEGARKKPHLAVWGSARPNVRLSAM